MKDIKLIKVFIASPGDTSEQREEVAKIIYKWNQENMESIGAVLMPVRWEHNSTASYQNSSSGQDIINQQLLLESDILIALFKTRLGNEVDGYLSGTVAEIEIFYSKNKSHTGVFFEQVDAIPPSDVEDFYNLKKYKNSLKEKGLYSQYSTDNIKRYISYEVKSLLSSDRLKKESYDKKIEISIKEIDVFEPYEFDIDEQLFLIFSVEEEIKVFGELENKSSTIELIRIWEEKNFLSNFVSERYSDILDKLCDRGFLTAKGKSQDKVQSRKLKQNIYVYLKKYFANNSSKVQNLKLKKVNKEKKGKLGKNDLLISENDIHLYLKRKSSKSNKVIKAKAILSGNKYIVLKNSMIETIDSESIPPSAKEARLSANIVNGILKENKTFNSPSAAAAFVLGAFTNGRVDWKLNDGRTLKQLQKETFKEQEDTQDTKY